MSASPQFPKIPLNWTLSSEKILRGKIFAQVWRAPERKTGRFLFIVHGQAEQSNRYEHFPFYLNTAVDAIGILDLPGHGKSRGVRGHINNFDQYSEAALEAFQWSFAHAEKALGKLEPHWLGHSLGGLITLRTLLKKQDLPLKSVSVSAPLLGLAIKVPPLKRLFGILVEPILGALPLVNELDVAGLSHDPSVGPAYLKDPLNHNKVTPRFFVQMNREMELMKAPILQFPYNLLMITPLADPIVSWKAEFQFFERLKMKPGTQKYLQSFPGLYHEAFNESEKGRVFLALENWICQKR